MLLQTATRRPARVGENPPCLIPGVPCMTFRLLPLLAAIFLAMAGGAARAEPPPPREWHRLPPEQREHLRQQMREEWKRLTPEEREARKQAHREALGRLSPEEREAVRAHFQRKFQSLTPEEREAWRETMRRQHRKHHGPADAEEPTWK